MVTVSFKMPSWVVAANNTLFSGIQGISFSQSRFDSNAREWSHGTISKRNARNSEESFTCLAKTTKAGGVVPKKSIDIKEEDFSKFRDEKEWLASKPKPKGFGHGKTYDTSLEDKLLEDIQQSRKGLKTYLNQEETAKSNRIDTTVNVKIENLRSKPGSMKQEIESTLPQEGVSVWIGNLPKKKNIQRDLQTMFNEYKGLLYIYPVVSGDLKTRDPVCKGFAFFIFENENVANRFISEYHGKKLIFGKFERKITCRLSTKDDTILTDKKQRHKDEETDLIPGIKPDVIQQENTHDCFCYGNHYQTNSFEGEVIDNDGTKVPVNEEPDHSLAVSNAIAKMNINANSSNRETVAGTAQPEDSMSEMELNSSKSSVSGKSEKIQEKEAQTRHKKLKERELKSAGRKGPTLGSALRLKKKERSMLTDVLYKYGKEKTTTS